MKIGLTGSIACGKSTVSQYLRQKGCFIVDADAISRSLTAPGGEALPAVRAAFGDQVFDGDTLNRRALGEVVFADPAARKRLEGILHPLIISRMQRETEASGAPLVAWDEPLLYETGMRSATRYGASASRQACRRAASCIGISFPAHRHCAAWQASCRWPRSAAAPTM